MILAGGASRRFGSDKCFADWEGKPFIRRVADALLEVGDDLLILGRPDVSTAQYHELVPEARIKVDVQIQSGPVVALRNASREFRHEWVFVAPCDAPAFTGEMARQIFEEARKAKKPAVAEIAEGTLWDLFCAPRTPLEDRLKTARRLEELLEEAVHVTLPAASGLNVNEPL